MKKTILVVVAAAGLSVLALGQSDKKQADPKQSNQVTSPRDAATGQASGRKGNYDVKKMEGTVQDESQANASRDAQSGKATGKVQNVSADAATQTTVSQPAEQHDVKSPRDLATGQASGKRQHPPAATTSSTEEAKPDQQPKK